jgi:hypothetical protein
VAHCDDLSGRRDDKPEVCGIPRQRERYADQVSRSAQRHGKIDALPLVKQQQADRLIALACSKR